MPEIPDYQSLMLPLLRYAATEEMTVPRAVERLANEFRLSDDQLAQMLPSGGTPLINNRAHWAKTYLSRAGLLEQPRRGVFKATPLGLEVLARNPDRIDNRTLAQFPSFLEFVKAKATVEGLSPTEPPTVSPDGALRDAIAETTSPSERVAVAAAEINASLKSALLDRIFAIEPVATRARVFEQLVIKLLVAMGYGGGREESAFHIGGRGDDGVDGVIHQDALGLDPVFVQAKCYDRTASIGPDKIREFKGALDDKGAMRGVFITTARFSEAARTPGRGSQKQVALIDGIQLAELMLRFSVGVEVEDTVVIKRIDEDFFESLGG